MPKRKRVTGDDGNDDECGRKRRRHLDVSEICHELYETIRSYKTDDGRLLCETFIRAPKRRSFADYYEVVSTPIDLLKIQQKIKTEEYTEIEQMTSDIELMVNNTKAYYKRGSQQYKDGCELWELYLDTKSEILDMASSDSKRDDDDQRSESHDDDENFYEELFAAVMTATDAEGRSLSTLFQLLPSKSRYPEYYKVIQEPIDLKTIATKIQNCLYQSLNDLEKDLLLLVKNAKLFNEPGSQIYKDAAALRKTIATKKAELDQRKSAPSKISERIRARRMAAGQKWSAITAALQCESDTEESAEGTSGAMQYQDDSEDDGNDSIPEDADSNPQWQLFETVKNYQNPQGYVLSEPFLKLPSKRLYPDYYREIKHPVSLFKIRSKIKSSYYNSTMDVVDDLNLMFENAKKYNRPDSKLFKDAVKLQKIMQSKARELINMHMKDSDSEMDSDERAAKRKLKKSLLATPRAKKIQEFDAVLRKRCKILYKTLLDFVDEAGRLLITVFMEKPSRKGYPDYYEIITNPIDMKTIDYNIKNDRYSCEEGIVADFRLMFNNCRQYNEEGSQIYRDAETLDRVLMAKLREMGPLLDTRIKGSQEVKAIKRGKNRVPTVLQYKLRTFYETIREYTDPKGRKLSTIFLKLPSKTDYPDYYEVIKRPVDLERIGVKLKNNLYEYLEDMLSDFILMFDNACKYNEPDSQIYKDALALQRIALQTKLELNDPEDGIPDVRALVQELLTNLFISVYNHQDEEGRCFSDSLVELTETDSLLNEQHNSQGRPLSLDVIKRNLDRGRYRRLDRFQEDMFEVFERARMVSRTDSQAFEDSIELQSFFIKTRDELCRNGDVFQSPALQYLESDLQDGVEALRAEKLPREQQEAELEPKQEKGEKPDDDMSSSADSVTFKGQVYHVGDFVYIEPREKGMEPHIILMEKLWRDNQGDFWIHGCWFYRPLETFHLANRKFLQKEVFKSDNYNSTPLSQVIGKCYVMFVKDYFKLRPEGFDDNDIYVCESRYSAKAKAFKKIKIWGFITNENIRIVPRSEPLDPVRVPSVFKDGVEKTKETDPDFDDGDISIIDKPRPNIVCEVENPEDGCIYYEQFTIPCGIFKLGDCCYVRTENEKNLIARIDRMWVDRTGCPYFHGPWFVTPLEIYHSTTRLFYKQEVFLSSIEDTNPLLSIVGCCAVMDLKDYCICRPTEILEEDIYVCESRYLEAERIIRKSPKGLKKFTLSPDVIEDEIYFFKKMINPQRTEVFSSCMGDNRSGYYPAEYSPMSKILLDAENDESNDMPPPTMPRDDQGLVGTPVSVKKKPLKKLVTGYILFASEVRKAVVAANPEKSFGEISRMIGTEWRNLPTLRKSEYEERAQKQNEDMAVKEGWDSYPQSPASAHGSSSGGGGSSGVGNPLQEKDDHMVFECLWDNCDFQFEDMQDLYDHLLAEAKGHMYQTYPNPKGEGEFQCLWLNCSRIKRNVPPFPNMQRLLRHSKEVHLKAASRVVLPESRSRNYVPSRRCVASPSTSATAANSCTGLNTPSYLASHISTPGMTTVSRFASQVSQPVSAGYLPSQFGNQSVAYPATRAPDPIFVASPPRPYRLLHSNTYIKYIENLQPSSKYISDWDSQLKATKENTPLVDSHRIPSNWLANGAGTHGSVANALWALRDYMLRDALSISKIT